MLGKLIKHEFKAVSKILYLLHLALIIVTAIELIIVKIHSKSPIRLISITVVTLYIALIIIISVAILIYFIVHFYRTLFTDQGYLINTLPVKPYEIILSKIIVAFTWTIINSIITIISITLIIMANNSTSFVVKVINNIAASFQAELGFSFNLFALIFIIYAIFSTVYMLLMVYASISLGQAMGKHKILSSFAAYMILYTINQAISTALLIPFGFYSLIDELNFDKIILPIFIMTFLMLIVLSAIYFIIINYILNKKLNLE